MVRLACDPAHRGELLPRRLVQIASRAYRFALQGDRAEVRPDLVVELARYGEPEVLESQDLPHPVDIGGAQEGSHRHEREHTEPPGGVEGWVHLQRQ